MSTARRLLPAGLRRRLRTIAGGLVAPASPTVPHVDPSGSSLEAIRQARIGVAAMFLRGSGIEIGALHLPLQMPEGASVKYVDRMSAADLRHHYVELAELPIVDVDIIDNGETLATFSNAGQDFIVANHFLEHCQDPIRTASSLFRVLKTGGVLFMAVPDKRWTFDHERPCTPLEHLLRDHAEGPEWSKRAHFEEWTRLVNHTTDEAKADEETRHLINIDYSIHFHVWDAPALIGFLTTLRQFLSFELELILRNGPETIFVLRKTA
jgi:predicted SAM-dependent methyltransferase